jgi:uncharacterized protein YajQ (UPF0234 family)
MQNYSIAIFLALAIPLITNEVNNRMDTNPLSVKFECKNNPECVFEGKPITVEITISNPKNYDIGIPFEYLERRGPYCTIVDTLTREEVQLGVGLPRESLRKKFVKLKPGERVKVERTIVNADIQAFKAKMVDIQANLTIISLIKLPELTEPIQFRSASTMHIVGRDTLEARKLQPK